MKNPTDATIVGADGCKGGWFFFQQTGAAITFGIAKDINSLMEPLPKNSRVFIDIPIGLLDTGESVRDCDRLARRLLGMPRAASVFSAPAYAVLVASTYEDAKQKSAAAIGKKLSRQTFGIVPKIREVNDYLRLHPQWVGAVREIHPELCFWSLNHQQSMRYSKKQRDGFEERLQVLLQFFPNAQALIDEPLKQYPRSKLVRDDVVDALVALATAALPARQLKTIPASPQCDARGLPMEIVCPEMTN